MDKLNEGKGDRTLSQALNLNSEKLGNVGSELREQLYCDLQSLIRPADASAKQDAGFLDFSAPIYTSADKDTSYSSEERLASWPLDRSMSMPWVGDNKSDANRETLENLSAEIKSTGQITEALQTALKQSLTEGGAEINIHGLNTMLAKGDSEHKIDVRHNPDGRYMYVRLLKGGTPTDSWLHWKQPFSHA